MTEITIILLMAAITFAFRFLPLLFIKSPEQLPNWALKWFEYIPPAILAAITIQASVSAVEDSVQPSNINYLAYVVCAIVALKTKNIFKSLGFGMLTLLLINILL